MDPGMAHPLSSTAQDHYLSITPSSLELVAYSTMHVLQRIRGVHSIGCGKHIEDVVKHQDPIDPEVQTPGPSL